MSKNRYSYCDGYGIFLSDTSLMRLVFSNQQETNTLIALANQILLGNFRSTYYAV
jgi:hypothetical protein